MSVYALPNNEVTKVGKKKQFCLSVQTFNPIIMWCSGVRLYVSIGLRETRRYGGPEAQCSSNMHIAARTNCCFLLD